MQILGPLRPTKSETQGVGPRSLFYQGFQLILIHTKVWNPLGYCNPTTTWVTSTFTFMTHPALWPLYSLTTSVLMTPPSTSATHSYDCTLNLVKLKIPSCVKSENILHMHHNLFIFVHLYAFLEWWQTLQWLYADKETSPIFWWVQNFSPKSFFQAPAFHI